MQCMERLISQWNVGNENLIVLAWKTSHHTALDSMCSRSDDSCNTFPYCFHKCFIYLFIFFREKWIFFRCFLTCRENSIMPPFIIAAFRSSGLFEVLSGIKLMEHLTFLLCRHTLLSLLHCYILTHVASHDTLFGKRCARFSEQLATSQQKPIWANEILQDLSWGLVQTVQSTFIAFAWLEIWCTQMIQSKEY